MSRSVRIVYGCAIALLLFGCNSKSDFQGIDNDLLALSLIIGGEKYEGKMVENRIVVITVPKEIDLNNAQVNYRISENAKIIPLPETIKDWNNEQVFNIISYNGSQKTYIVKIDRTGEMVEGTIRLTTDEEVKEFIQKKITEIKGNLIIGNITGTDSISNIDALTYLTKVQYKIIVNPTYKGKDLAGLRNLREVGSLIVNNKGMTEIVLKNLEQVRVNVLLNTESVKKLLLPRLKTIEKKFDINADQLTDTDFSSITQLGDLSIKSNSIAVLSFKNLQKVTGNISLIALPNLLKLDLNKTEKIEGYFIVRQSPSLRQLKMNNLLDAGSDLEISGTAISSLVLPKLQYVKGSVIIEGNSNLENISAKDLLIIEGVLNLTNLPVKSLNDIGLEEVKQIKLIRLTSLVDINPFLKKLNRVKGDIEMSFLLFEGVIDASHLDMRYQITNPDNTVVTLYGGIILRSCTNCTLLKLPENCGVSISGDRDFIQDHATNISGSGYISGISYSIRLAPGEELQINGIEKIGRLSLSDCHKISGPDLTEIDLIELFPKENFETVCFPKLKEINHLKINGMKNKKPVNLNAFSHTTILKTITITNNKSLTDYLGLKKTVESDIELEEVYISGNAYNPTFEDLKAGRYVMP